MRWRSSSRTSPSQRENAPGSLRLGLKKRWFTDRISTPMRKSPTRPSAAPNPVMLRIIGNRASYGAASTLSIPELPADTVQVALPRHLVTRYDLVELTYHVAELPEGNGAHQPDLELSGENAAGRRNLERIAPRKEDFRPVVVTNRGEDSEVPTRKAADPVRLQVQIASRLPLGTVGTRLLPVDANQVRVERVPDAPASAREDAPSLRLRD